VSNRQECTRSLADDRASAINSDMQRDDLGKLISEAKRISDARGSEKVSYLLELVEVEIAECGEAPLCNSAESRELPSSRLWLKRARRRPDEG